MKIPVLFFAAFESTHSLLAAELQNRTARVRIPDWHGNDDAVDVLLVVECARQQETRELTAFFREQDKVVSDSHRAPVGKHSRWIALRIYRSHWTPKLQLVVSLLRNQRNVTKRSAMRDWAQRMGLCQKCVVHPKLVRKLKMNFNFHRNLISVWVCAA